MKNLYNSYLKKIVNMLLEKLVLLIWVLYAVACHSVTKYCFTWCSVVIHVMFNTVKLSYIVFEKTDKNKQMWKIIDAGKSFISNYL
jgi:hypothetical protein